MWTSLPLSIRLSILGLAATVLLVVGAVALRTSPYAALEQDEARATAPLARSGSAAAGPREPERAPSTGGTTSAARSVTPSEAAPAVTGDAREARAALGKELQLGRYAAATEDLARLIELEPKSAENGEVRGDIVELSMRVMLLTGGEPDRVFDLISTKMGTPGIDILYELLTTRGGSRAATRAEELLGDEKVRARGTPAMRIAYDLRSAHGCEDKKALFARARTDGDNRTLGQLQLLNRSCGRRAKSCCLQNDPELREAMDGIKARLN
jgi:hypothetical protein